MATTLTAYAYGNVETLHGVFNAIAMITSSSDFADMTRLAVLVGFLVVASASVTGHIHKGWNWIISVVLISGVMLVPKADVTIEDKLGQQSPVVISNVPWALALVASVKSSVGATLTTLFETAFQTIPGTMALPSELSYLDHGMMFGNRLIKASREAEISSPTVQTDTLNYLRSCVFPSLARDISPADFQKSASLVDLIGSTNPALFSTYHDSSGKTITDTCPTVYSKIKAGLSSQGTVALAAMAQRMYPSLSTASAQTKVADSLVSIYGRTAVAQAGMSAADIMVQNILINATADASALYGASLNDPSIMLFASMRTQAVSQMNAGYLVQGRIAEESLPLLRNVTEAILYAMFPIMCVLALASEGQALVKMLRGYLHVLLWVELWPPMFAIVNYIKTMASTKAIAAASTMGGTASAMTLDSATVMYSTSVSDVAVTAWMVTFVPVLAAALLFGFDKVMSIAGASGGGGATDSAAGQGTKGNLALGGMSFGQQELSTYRSDAAVTRTSGVGGQSLTNLLTGQSVDTYAQSSGPVSIKDTAGWGQRLAEGASAATESGNQANKSFEKSLDSAYGQALALAKSGGLGKTRVAGEEVSKLGADGLSATDVDRSAEKIAKRFDIADSSTVQKALQAGIGAPIPFIRLGGQTSTTEQEQLQKAINAERSALHDLGIQRKHDLVTQFKHDDKFQATRNSNKEASERIDSSMREAQSWREQASASFGESRRLQASREKYEAFSRTGEANWANEFYAFARAQGVDPSQGKASTHQLKDLLTQFIDSGEVFKDDGGKAFWVPHQGQGPNIQQETLAFTQQTLRQGFDNTKPGGGPGAIAKQHQAFDKKVKKAQESAGVTPNQNVKNDLAPVVQQGQAAAEAAINAASQTVNETKGEQQLAWNERAENTSAGHNPVYSANPLTGEPTPNPAQQAVRLKYANDTHPFKPEADAEQQRREAELTDIVLNPAGPIPGTKEWHEAQPKK